jgi:uncharacterized membrane protein YbhN (UPF0104 family)
MNRRVAGFLLRGLLVAAIVALGVRFARGLDRQKILAALAGASLPLLALSALGNLPLVWTKARRMRVLLDGQRTNRLMALYFASYAADNLVMSQAGLGMRVGVLKLWGVPLPTAASAQAVEKAIEALGLALLAVPFLWLPGEPSWLRPAILWVSAGALAALVAAVALLPRVGRLKSLALGAAALKRPRAALEIALLTLAGWSFEAGMVTATLAGLHLHPPYVAAAAVVLVAVNLAALVPGLPGNFGTFEVTCALAAGAAGVPGAEAVSFAIVYHALHTIPVTVAGVILQRWIKK